MIQKTVLVTGAGRGIGAAVCRRLAAEGAIVYAGMRSPDKLQNLTFPENGISGKVIPIQLDVCDPGSIKICILTIKKERGKLDILVNNAGITILERLEMIADSSIEKRSEERRVGKECRL